MVQRSWVALDPSQTAPPASRSIPKSLSDSVFMSSDSGEGGSTTDDDDDEKDPKGEMDMSFVMMNSITSTNSAEGSENRKQVVPLKKSKRRKAPQVRILKILLILGDWWRSSLKTDDAQITGTERRKRSASNSVTLSAASSTTDDFVFVEPTHLSPHSTVSSPAHSTNNSRSTSPKKASSSSNPISRIHSHIDLLLDDNEPDIPLILPPPFSTPPPPPSSGTQTPNVDMLRSFSMTGSGSSNSSGDELSSPSTSDLENEFQWHSAQQGKLESPNGPTTQTHHKKKNNKKPKTTKKQALPPNLNTNTIPLQPLTNVRSAQDVSGTTPYWSIKFVPPVSSSPLETAAATTTTTTTSLDSLSPPSSSRSLLTSSTSSQPVEILEFGMIAPVRSFLTDLLNF